MAFWAAAIPALAGLAGGLLNKMGAGAQADAQREHIRYAERGRRAAKAALRPIKYRQTANMFAPGLLNVGPNAAKKGIPTQPDWFTRGVQDQVVPNQGTTNPNVGMDLSGALDVIGRALLQGRGAPGASPGGGSPPQPRAQGGPVEQGKPYLVGERGPEVVTPQAPGQVAPAQAPQQAQPAAPNQPTAPPPQGGQQAPVQGAPLQQGQPQAAPAQGGATVGQTPQAPAYTAPNEALMAHIYNFLMNPGQTSTIAYERQQEQIGSGLQNSIQQLVGGAAGSGVDPSSAMVGEQIQNSILNAGKLRSEAARDQSLVEEQLRRADIGAGADLFFNFLNYINSVQQGRAQAASGQGVAPISAPINPYGSLGAGVANAGQIMGQYLSSRPQQQTFQGVGGDYDPNAAGPN